MKKADDVLEPRPSDSLIVKNTIYFDPDVWTQTMREGYIYYLCIWEWLRWMEEAYVNAEMTTTIMTNINNTKLPWPHY